MKTLVTGGTGFIGSHLVEALVAKGCGLRCLVRPTSDTRHLKKLGIELVYGDLLDKESLRKAIDSSDVVYHLAGEVYSKKSSDFYKVNVEGTRNLIEACVGRNIGKFIYFSSIAAVGPSKNKETLLNEDTPCNPITAYGKSKYEAEKLISSYFNLYDFPAVILRAPIVYGPGQSSEVTRIFRLIQREQFRIIGNGEALKSLCYIENLIEAAISAEQNESSKGKIYFVADEKPYTIIELARTIAEIENVKLSHLYINSIVADLSWFWFRMLDKILGLSILSLHTIKAMTLNFGCDIAKARRELSYQPRISLKEGIQKTVEWLYEKKLINHE